MYNFRWVPSRFSKCCFHSFIRSCWLVAFSLALVVLFLLLTSFIVCHTILDCLSSTESLILSIWFCMHSVCSFRNMHANSFCAFFSFRAFVFVGFFLLHLEAVFTSNLLIMQHKFHELFLCKWMTRYVFFSESRNSMINLCFHAIFYSVTGKNVMVIGWKVEHLLLYHQHPSLTFGAVVSKRDFQIS